MRGRGAVLPECCQVFLLENLTFSSTGSRARVWPEAPNPHWNKTGRPLGAPADRTGRGAPVALRRLPRRPVSAVAQVLSRLAREGRLERLSKGVYCRPRQTALGKSRPNPAAIFKLPVTRDNYVFPAGIAAANLLGFTTQSAGRGEVATSGRRASFWAATRWSIPAGRKFGRSCRKPTRRCSNSPRRAGQTSELSPEETVKRTLLLP